MTTSGATGLRTFTIDKTHSDASFVVRHFVSKVHGRFGDFSGAIQLDPAKPDASSVVFTIKAASDCIKSMSRPASELNSGGNRPRWRKLTGRDSPRRARGRWQWSSKMRFIRATCGSCAINQAHAPEHN